MEKTVNKLWFFMIISECVLNYKTGLKHSRAGSPFAQLRKQLPECPRDKKQAIIWLDEVTKNLPDFNRPKSFDALLDAITTSDLKPAVI